jgi:hypothetical protein
MQTPGKWRLSRLSRLADFFGRKRNLVTGAELWMRFVPKFIFPKSERAARLAFCLRLSLFEVGEKTQELIR